MGSTRFLINLRWRKVKNAHEKVSLHDMFKGKTGFLREKESFGSNCPLILLKRDGIKRANNNSEGHGASMRKLEKGSNAARKKLRMDICKNKELYFLLVLPLLYLLIFKYYPMYGAQIAFRKYSVAKGFWGSPWVGLANFRKFVNSVQFSNVVSNTLILSFYSLIAGFPIPVLLALMLQYCRSMRFKKVVQMVTYAPHFISVVVLCGMIMQFVSPRYGFIALLLKWVTGETVDLMAKPAAFRHIYVWSGVWQGMGWGSIIYLSALSAVDPQLHEAAEIDGAVLIQRIWHIDIPCILPTVTIMLVLSCGSIMSVGYEKVLLLQNDINLSTSQVISTYVYKIGIAGDMPNYSYSTAIDLFTAVINLILLTTVNAIAKRMGQSSLF